jgi:hypothetical protein
LADDRLRLLFRPEGELLQRARACEAEVFLRAYGNTEADFAAEYGPYDAASHFIALADGDDEIVAACRLISPSPAGLKTVNDVSRPPWGVDGERAVRAAGADPDLTWDVATIAVRQRRGLTPLASAALYHGLVLATRANAVRWIVMMLDERARRLLAIAGFVARPIPGTTTAEYLGSAATTPLVGDVATMIDNQRRGNPDAYRLMSLGAGLEGFEIPPLENWIVTDSNRGLSPDVRQGLARSA